MPMRWLSKCLYVLTKCRYLRCPFASCGIYFDALLWKEKVEMRLNRFRYRFVWFCWEGVAFTSFALDFLQRCKEKYSIYYGKVSFQWNLEISHSTVVVWSTLNVDDTLSDLATRHSNISNISPFLILSEKKKTFSSSPMTMLVLTNCTLRIAWKV